ncbi:MAG: hypothetical protein EOO89_18210 [Pedobacter sp.]|nr:MAG: hypothetical protein EOO89_18210 [Pedobacter sp.]
MNVERIITEVAVLFSSGVLVLGVWWMLVKQELFSRLRPPFRASKEQTAILLPLRLQANERLIVFVERINPVNLLIRLHHQGISVQELQAGILNEIRQEYQHNITQQLYVNKAVWAVIKKLKEDTIAMINTVVQNLPDDATGVDISKRVLQHMSMAGDNPYDLTIDLLKEDIHKLF